MRGVPEYRLKETKWIADKVVELYNDGNGLRQIDIVHKLGISRGRARYYCVKANADRTPAAKQQKVCGKDTTPRNTPQDWKSYMEKNKHYAKMIVNGKPLHKVCAETFQLRKRMRRGEANFFIEGLPEEKTQTDFSVGYGDR